MKPERIIEVVTRYETDLLDRSGVVPIQDVNAKNVDGRLEHVAWMCGEVKRFAQDPMTLDKAERWLGFIQGVLWGAGVYSIDEMRTDNR